MKTKLLSLTFLSLMVPSIASFADKIVITGEPVILEKQGEVYVVPSTYVPTTSYYYSTIDGRNMVCYATAQESLASLEKMTIWVNMGGKKVRWQCYTYDTTYFEVRP